MKKDRMTFWGIGKTMILVTLAYAVPVSVLTFLRPETYAPKFLPPAVSVAIGTVLLLCGGAMLVASGKAVVPAFREGELLTTGVYGFVRNPLYCAWIFFIFPGIVFLTHWWLLFGMTVVSFAYFKFTIRKERQYLLDKFGEEYVQYERNVSEIIPWPRRFRRSRSTPDMPTTGQER